MCYERVNAPLCIKKMGRNIYDIRWVLLSFRKKRSAINRHQWKKMKE